MKDLPLDPLKFLSDQQIHRIHRATLELLEDTGLASDSEMILTAFRKAGAPVDVSAGRIKLPPNFVEACLKTVPRSFVLCGRDPSKDLTLEGRNTFFGLGGSPVPHFREVGTGEIRTPTKQDMINSTVLGDALENINFVMSLAGAYDCDPQMHYLHEFDALLRNTSKPIVYCAPSKVYARQLIEMASAVAGGESEFRQRPNVMLFAESLSPLTLPRYCEGMAEFAKAGGPILFAPSAIMGASGPVTLSGFLVLCNAETLAGICLAQILQPGTPVVYGPHTPVLDMQTARSTYAASEQAVARVGVAQLAAFYGIPSFGTAGGTDSKCPDAQAGAEVAQNIFMNVAAGMNLSQGVGTMASGSYGCLEMAVICDEIIGMAKRMSEGIIVDDEALAMDIIRQVGPGGHFLDHPHTAKFFKREMYIPRLFDRQPEELWLQAGGRRIDQMATEKVRKILAEHHPQVVSGSADAELRRILAENHKNY